MVQSLLYWCGLYEKLKTKSLCIDIETTHFNGPISVVGLYRPKEGPIEYKAYVRGESLTLENLKHAFSRCKMLITFNGIIFDVPRLKATFPGIIPDKMPIIDLYRFARKLGMNTNLRVLENTLGIERLEKHTERRGIAVKLWKQYEQYGYPHTLKMLLEYNKQDTINLYPIAELLVYRARQKIENQAAHHIKLSSFITSPNFSLPNRISKEN